MVHVSQKGMTKAGIQRSFTYMAPPRNWADWDEAALQFNLPCSQLINNKDSVYRTMSWLDSQEPRNEKSIFPVQHLPPNKTTTGQAVTPAPSLTQAAAPPDRDINRRNAKGNPWL